MHFDSNIIFVIVAAIIGISRLVARISENSRKQSERRRREAQSPQAQAPHQQPKSPPPIFTRPKTDEERVREFLEALGAPPGATPSPKIQPRTDIPLRPVAPISPPPLPRPFSPVLLKPLAEKARKIFAPPAAATFPPAEASGETAEPGAWLREEETIESAAAKFEATAPSMSPAATLSPLSWKNALRSRDSIRAAFVLREILGPPCALREPEFI